MTDEIGKIIAADRVDRTHYLLVKLEDTFRARLLEDIREIVREEIEASRD